MGAALEGIRVVDLTSEFYASLAAALLGDFGADVIRVENTASPRPVDPDRDGMHPPERWDSLHELAQRNKRSLALDLSSKGGRETLARLLGRADVFVTDLGFEEARQLDLDPETLATANPALVYTRASGFGPKGPDRDLPALDELAAAHTGVMGSLPQPGQPPVYSGIGQMQTAAMLAFGSVLALRHCERSGEGQTVDASLLGGNMFSQSLDLQAYLAIRDDRFLLPIDRLDASNPMSGPMYPCSDGRWVTLAMPDTDKYWPAFAEITGLALDDPRFDSHEKRCETNRLEMLRVLEAVFQAQPGAHWKAELDRMQLPADVIEKYDHPAADPAAEANRYIIEVDHAEAGSVKSLGFPVHLAESPAALTRLAPAPGEHSEEILRELEGGAESPARETAGTEAAPALPLEGLRVLDLTQWLQGPVCAQYLADFGAEVIHVERPVHGDGARGVRSIKALAIGDWNQYFLVINRNKKSLAIDLKSEAGRELFYQLVEKSDVFLSNFQPESLRAWGLTWEELSKRNPKLIYATNTGYGHAVEVNRPSYDINVQALTGLMTRQGEPGQPPIYLGMGSGDTYGGMLSALGILLALHQRQKTGRGQALDASLYGAQLFMAAPTLQPFLAGGNPLYSEPQPRLGARNPLWNRYRAADDWLTLCAENNDSNWQALTASLPSTITEDPRFASSPLRSENAAALVGALDAAIAARPGAEWIDAWSAGGLACSRIRTLKDLAADPQAWANDYLLRVHCDEVGREVEIRGLPVGLSKTPGRVERLGPELGQDTEILLMEALGLEWDAIEKLKSQGAIP